MPGGTEPIILHRDAVSGGGYFMVGTVVSADMDLIGQMQPNMPVRFISVDMEAALAARRERQALLEKVRAALPGQSRATRLRSRQPLLRMSAPMLPAILDADALTEFRARCA